MNVSAKLLCVMTFFFNTATLHTMKRDIQKRSSSGESSPEEKDWVLVESFEESQEKLYKKLTEHQGISAFEYAVFTDDLEFMQYLISKSTDNLPETLKSLYHVTTILEKEKLSQHLAKNYPTVFTNKAVEDILYESIPRQLIAPAIIASKSVRFWSKNFDKNQFVQTGLQLSAENDFAEGIVFFAKLSKIFPNKSATPTTDLTQPVGLRHK